MTEKAQAIGPPELASAPAARFFYSHGVRRDAQLWISGQVSMDSAGSVVAEDDITGQAERVFENLSAVLRAAGGDFSHVVATTTYVTDRSLLVPVNEVRGRYLTTDPAPTSTLLVVAGLAPSRVPSRDQRGRRPAGIAPGRRARRVARPHRESGDPDEQAVRLLSGPVG